MGLSDDVLSKTNNSSDGSGGSSDGSIEELRQRVLERVRRERREVLKDPLNHKNYLDNIALLEASKLEKKMNLNDIRSVVNDLLGLGPLQNVLSNKRATEILLPRYDLAYAEYDGVLVEEPMLRFRDETHFFATLQKIAMTVRRPLDESHPIVDAKLPDGSRVNIVTSLSVRGSTAQIRRWPQHYSMQELLASGTLTTEVYQLICQAIKVGLNIVITGAMSSGKTTLLNAIIELIGEIRGSQTRVVIYEDIAELNPNPQKIKHVVQIEARLPNIDGKGGITLKELAQTQMVRSRADWLVLGEMRGQEAFYVIEAMNLGHYAASTFHSFNVYDAILNRLPGMAVMSEEGRAQGWQGALQKIASGIDLAIHMGKVEAGNRYYRKVVQVAEVLQKKLSDSTVVPEVNLLHAYDIKKEHLMPVAEPKVFGKKGWWIA